MKSVWSIAPGIGVIAVLTMAMAGPGFARDSNAVNREIDALQQQVQQMQRQIDALKVQQRQQAAEAAAAKQQAMKAAKAAENKHGPHVVETRGHRFGMVGVNGRNSIFLTGRVHIDAGAYFDYRPGAAAKAAHPALTDDINLRRARIGVVGRFDGDWDYALIYDFGGSTDSLSSLASGVETAHVTYNGFYAHHQAFPVAIDFGIGNVPWTLDQSISSNDIMFVERSSALAIATSFGGGDFRSALGVRSNNDRYFLGAYLTGPTSGALHSYSDKTCPALYTVDECNGPQMAFLVRGSYRVLKSAQGSLQIGLDYANEFRPRDSHNQAIISLSDRPELRIDPTKFIGTGAMNASDGQVIGAELAGTWRNAFLQGEYFHYMVDRIGAPNVAFNGGYVQASYAIGGRRHYHASTGAYTGVIPEHDLSWSGTSWGAIELAARYSVVDLNDTGVASPISGGEQQTYTVGLNYYPSENMRFMLDLEHVDIAYPGASATKNVSFDAVAARTQVNF